LKELSTITERPEIANAISNQAFSRIAEIAEREAGIVLAPSKVSMVTSRLTRRLRALKLSSFEEYLNILETSQDRAELDSFVSALTTNVSHFFRENHHFEYLATTMLPKFKQKLAKGGKVRIWSAGCSNGQEPYSIAMTILKDAPELTKEDLKILATDIDPEVLSRAQSGQYFGSLTTGLTNETITRFFTRSPLNGEDTLTIKPEVKKLVAFRQLNLHAPWPMHGKFDAIFCRNVVIYFDEQTQIRLFKRFADILETGGWLMLGHSERLNEDVAPLFENSGVTTYQTLHPTSPSAPIGAYESKGLV